jgi:hypothetical protein
MVDDQRWQRVAHLEQQLHDAETGDCDPERTRMLRRQLATAQRRAQGVVGIVDQPNDPDPFSRPQPPQRPRHGRWVTRVTSYGSERVWDEGP